MLPSPSPPRLPTSIAITTLDEIVKEFLVENYETSTASTVAS